MWLWTLIVHLRIAKACTSNANETLRSEQSYATKLPEITALQLANLRHPQLVILVHGRQRPAVRSSAGEQECQWRSLDMFQLDLQRHDTSKMCKKSVVFDFWFWEVVFILIMLWFVWYVWYVVTHFSSIFTYFSSMFTYFPSILTYFSSISCISCIFSCRFSTLLIWILAGLIQFWAAGRSCCEELFNCGDARRGAKGGLVFLEDPEMKKLDWFTGKSKARTEIRLVSGKPIISSNPFGDFQEIFNH